MAKFKEKDLVKYADGWYSPGEEKYVHTIIEVRDHTDIGWKCHYLIGTLNTLSALGSTSVVEEEMIRLATEEEISALAKELKERER